MSENVVNAHPQHMLVNYMLYESLGIPLSALQSAVCRS